MAKDLFDRAIISSFASKLSKDGIKVEYRYNDRSTHPYLIEFNGDVYEFNDSTYAAGFMFGLQAAFKKDK